MGRLWRLIAIVCLASLAFGVVPTLATTIAEIWTPDEVVLAADSAGSFFGGDQPDNVQAVCKIYHVGRFFFGVAGLVNDPVAGFSVPQIVARELRNERSTNDAFEAVERSLIAELSSERLRLKARGLNPTAPTEPDTTVLGAAVESGIPTAYAIDLHYEGLPPGAPPRLTHAVCPSDSSQCKSGSATLLAGAQAAIHQRGQTLAETIAQPLALARGLVQLEIDAGSPRVGGPVDVVQLLSSGQVNVESKPGCPTVLEP